MEKAEENILTVRNLKKYFPLSRLFEKEQGFVRAVDDVSFSIAAGEAFGVVGESGCGKSTMGKVILRLLQPTEGEIIFMGQNIAQCSKKQLRLLRRQMQFVFQDPFGSLDPHMKVRNIIGEPLYINRIAKGKELAARVNQLLVDVGLSAEHGDRYPHEFSGGQRQRIGIARALALRPRLIVCDEPVSALDVSNQAQILNLLDDLKKQYGFTYIFIAHGLAAVRYISTRIGVMYLGKMVEIGETDAVCHNGLHPYTQALLSAALDPDPNVRTQRILLDGDVPSPVDPPSGCRFHTRCPYRKQICEIAEPSLLDTGNQHLVACHKVNNQSEYNLE